MDIKAFSRWIKEYREGFEADMAKGLADRSEYASYLRDDIAANRHLWAAAPRRTLEQFADEISVAAMNAGPHGATAAQVAAIVEIARASGDLTGLSGGRLTKGEAANIIRHALGH